MKTTVAALALSVLICACNKNKVMPVNNTNDPVQVIDSALLFDNISDSVLMGVYDSINIPFIVRTNYEGTRKITLSVSGMPTRLKAELTTSSGTTPLSSTLKLYTHLPIDKPLQGVIITATDEYGHQYKQPVTLQLRYANREIIDIFYELAKNATDKQTYYMDYDPEASKEPRPIIVSDGPDFNKNAVTGAIYLTNLYLLNGYVSVDNMTHPENNISSILAYPDKGQVSFTSNTIKGTFQSATDTFSVVTEAMNYNYDFPDGRTGYKMSYTVNLKRYYISGVFQFK